MLLPLYTFFITKKEMGEYDLLITTVALLVPLVSLQLSDAAYRWLISINDTNNTHTPAGIITNSLFTLFAAFFVFMGLFCILLLFQQFRYSSYFLILLFLSSLLPYLQSLLRGLGKTKEFAFTGIVTTFLLVIANVIFVYLLKLKIEGIILANIIGNGLAIAVIIYRLQLLRYLNIRLLNRKLVIEMLRYSLPLIPNLMSWWLIGSANKFIILHYLGVETNGLYAISNRFPAILVIVNSVLILPIQDAYLREDNNIRQLERVANHFMYIELVLILILSIGAPIYTKFLVEKSFYESWVYMPLLYLGVGTNTMAALISLIYQKEKKTLRITTTTIIGGISTIGLCFLLIRNMGLLGVSLSYLFGFLIMFVLRFIDIRRNYSFKLNYKATIPLFLLFVLAFVLQLNASLKYQLVIFASVCAGLLIYNKKEILKLIKNNAKPVL